MRVRSGPVTAPPAPTLCPSPPAGKATRRWGLVVLAALPFQLPLVQHLLTGRTATGFLLYDAPYYMANARAIFERGNGLAYPNPFDPDPSSPVIYFHWLLWLLGAGVKFLHLDPGALFAGVGVAASIVCCALTLRLVELVLPDSRGRSVWFLLTMWGGGALVLTAGLLNLAQGRPAWDDLFRFDVGNGWWFSNWGLNLLLSTEAVYHCLVVGAWIGVLQKRWPLALGGVAALAATHPFSGGQHLLILGTWLGVEALRERTPAAWWRVAIVGGLGAIFGAYYFGFLSQFPAHRALVAVWSNAHEVRLVSLLLAVGPWAALAAWRFRREPWRAGGIEAFFVTTFVVTFLLLQHDWLLPSRQPAHFSRGYHWLPLWLLALPLLQAWFTQLAAARGRFIAGVALGLAGPLLAADNLAFLGRELHDGERDRVSLSEAQREIYEWMDAADLRGVLLCYDLRLSYHAAIYSGARPYVGHLNNTPDIRTRWRQVAAWHREGETGPWFEAIDYLLIDRRNPPAYPWSGWVELHRNEDYLLVGRTPKP